jgi:hypothetical protein
VWDAEGKTRLPMGGTTSGTDESRPFTSHRGNDVSSSARIFYQSTNDRVTHRNQEVPKLLIAAISSALSGERERERERADCEDCIIR